MEFKTMYQQDPLEHFKKALKEKRMMMMMMMRKRKRIVKRNHCQRSHHPQQVSLKKMKLMNQ